MLATRSRTSALSAAIRLTSWLIPWLVASTSPMACTTSPTWRFMLSKFRTKCWKSWRVLSSTAPEASTSSRSVPVWRWVESTSSSISPVWRPISLVAALTRSARRPTSLATTAKPRPASPARAASTPAFRASNCVCNAMSLISLLISPTDRARSVSWPTTSVKAAISRVMRSTRSLTSDSSASACSAARRFWPDTSAISRAWVDVDADSAAICAPLAASASAARACSCASCAQRPAWNWVRAVFKAISMLDCRTVAIRPRMPARKRYNGHAAGLNDSGRSESVARPWLSRRNNPQMPPNRNVDLAKMAPPCAARIVFYGHPLPGRARPSPTAGPRFLLFCSLPKGAASHP
ncbi:Uncharacterised protein [Achromobacter xylosoxidans]|nr:Uncharacterised protein [Achromobacter xylosoxidans]